jgi:putative transcriptional regulator
MRRVDRRLLFLACFRLWSSLVERRKQVQPIALAIRHREVYTGGVHPGTYKLSAYEPTMLRVRLNDLLAQRGMSQRELARRTESHPDVISRFAREATGAVSYDVLDRICEALGCEVSDLLEYVPTPADQIGLFEAFEDGLVLAGQLYRRPEAVLRIAEKQAGYGRTRDQPTGDTA